LAEIHDLRTKVEVLESTTRGLQVIPPVSP
jgi:hypothetical protein